MPVERNYRNANMTSSTVTSVIDGGVCVGCGNCAFVSKGQMQIDQNGFYQPQLGSAADEDSLAMACPFLKPDWNEDRLADRFLPHALEHDYRLGKYSALHAAHVVEADFRAKGSSGGMGSWLGVELLKKGLVDGVIHARPVGRDSLEAPFFRYGISRTISEIREAAHSHYHVVEISKVLEEVEEEDGRFLFVGVPCMVKALRRAQILRPELVNRVPYAMGLVCGHLKSIHWAMSLGWGAGVPPEDQEAITFRVKSESTPAKAYYFSIKSRKSDRETVHDSAAVTGGKFNLGAMMPDACNFCDDVFAETADITIGDAWLPQFLLDPQGKNMIVSRNPDLDRVLSEAVAEGRLKLDQLTQNEAAFAQAGGLRQRREGLRYRLERARRQGKWVPEKRNLPDMQMPSLLRARIYDMRCRISDSSRNAFRAALDARDFGVYETAMRRSFRALRRLELLMSAQRIIKVRLRTLRSRFRI